MTRIPKTIYLDKEVLTHIAKCTSSFPYFLKHAVYFQGPEGPMSPDKWEPRQLEVAQLLQENQETISEKSRQCGESWILGAFALWTARFTPYSRVIILSTTEVASKKLKQRINFMYDNMPPYLAAAIGANNVSQMVFPQMNSEISCLSSAPSSSRGETVALVILDEFAHMDKADLVWNAVRFTAAHGGKLVISSTHNGVGVEFYRLLTDAQNGLNSIKPVRLHYSELSFWTPEKIKRMRESMTQDQWDQEMECSALLSGRPVFNKKDIEEVCQYDLKIPTIGETFAGGIDPADGGGDFTAICVLSAQWREVYSEVNRKPLVAGIEYVKQVIEKYPGMWIIEKNNHGHAYLKDLRQYFQYNPKVSILEFTTSSKSKPQLFNKLAAAVEKHEIMLNSKIIKNEMMTLQYTCNDVNAHTHIQPFPGHHDDAVMSTALALRATAYLPYQPIYSEGAELGVVQIGSVDPWA